MTNEISTPSSAPTRASPFFLALGILSVLLSVGAVFAGFALMAREVPDVAILRDHYPWVTYQGKNLPPTVTIRKERPPNWVSLGAVSREAMGAVLVSEDWAFFQHKGYDPHQIKEAIVESWEEGRLSRGASTITQQVVRNVFLTKEKTLWRKFKELILAVELEKVVGKKRILEVYLNIAEWGEGFYGIGNASRRYFHKAPSGLTAKEGAFLAMLLPSPIRYGVSHRKGELTPYARKTIRSILRKMGQAHYLAADAVLTEGARPLPFEKNLTSSSEGADKGKATSLDADDSPEDEGETEGDEEMTLESGSASEGGDPGSDDEASGDSSAE